MSDDKPATLATLCAQGRALLHEAHDASGTHREFKYWDSNVAKWLDREYPDTGMSAEWSSLSTSPLVSDGHYYDFPHQWAQFRQAVQRRLAWLGRIGARKSSNSDTPLDQSATRKVFLVHGHHEAAREKIARFLERLDLEPVILHEQPNKGRTIIEKFTDYSQVAYAVVLLTGDDIGGTKGTAKTSLLPRARQNVIFELGYFLGKLGRDRVCALYEPGVDILSDYTGVLYLQLDSSDSWRLLLARELKAVGLPVDMNKAV
jgi:predicted nucleotide-binding protein